MSDRLYQRVCEAFGCARCGAMPGQKCKTDGGNETYLPHFARHRAAQQAGLLPFPVRETKEWRMAINSQINQLHQAARRIEHQQGGTTMTYEFDTTPAMLARETALERQERRVRRQEELLRREEERLTFLEGLPQEPELVKGDACVIYFRKRFGGSQRYYTYAAVGVPETGLWYSTGPKAPKGFTWDELVTWMFEGSGGIEDDTIWIATEFQAL